MPVGPVVMQRKTMRRDLGLKRLNETLLGTHVFSLGSGSSFWVLDPYAANADYSGQGMWNRAWVRAGSADYRVGSFNSPSGAWVSAQTWKSSMPSGGDFEVHSKMDPAKMDLYLDEAIMQLRVRQEVGIRTIDGATFYTLDAAASPNTIKSVLNVYYYADPNHSLNRRRHDLTQDQVVFTASGMELRLPGGLGASMQIVLDAMLQVTLGAADLATVNLGQYDEEVVLWGAAARCYDSLMQDSPGQEFGNYQALNRRAVMQWNRAVQKGMPQIDQKIGFDSPWEGQPGRVLGALDDWGSW